MSEQRATAQLGSTGNVIVQIVGDGNSVVVGCRHLRLTRYSGLRRQTSEIERLSPYSRSTTLVGRESDFVDLDFFLADSRQILTRVIAGRGGTGKTRLALELCERYAERGWNTGFVTRKELARFSAEQNAGDWGWQRPTLVVIDYAAAQVEALGTWFDELTTNTLAVPHRLRFLLLEREAKFDGGWFQSLFRAGGWTTAGRSGLLDPPEPVEILPIRHLADRFSLLREVLARESQGLHLPSGDAVFDQKLNELTWGGEPLFLMMAAHAMAKHGCEHALTLNREDLAVQLAANEAERLNKLSSVARVDPTLVRHLAACVTLAQGVSREAFLKFAVAEKLAIERPSGGDAAVLFDVLNEALSRSQGVAPVLPDMIGEAFVCRTLATGGAAVVLRCFQIFGFAVLEFVLRCAQDFKSLSLSPESSTPLKWLEEIVRSQKNDEITLSVFEMFFPGDSVVLQRLSLEVAERLSELRLSKKNISLEHRALALGQLARSRAKAGQRTRALPIAIQAKDFYRAIAAQHPGVPNPNLATALNVLVNVQVELGQYADALDTAREALSLHRDLASSQPDIFSQDLAASLNTMANCLSHLGESEEAVILSQEAVEIDRKLGRENRSTFRESLARSLTGLANRLGAIGQFEKAQLAAQESTEIYRVLAAEQPDVFQPGLAASLNNLATCFNDLGNKKLGLRAAKESVEISRKLRDQGAETFLPYLASSLHTLSNSFSDPWEYQLALDAAQEANQLYRFLSITSPDAFRVRFAGTSEDLATHYKRLGLNKEALQAALEALDLRREAASIMRGVFVPELARSLAKVAYFYVDCGNEKLAIRTIRESVELYRALVDKRPRDFLPNLADALAHLALRLVMTVSESENFWACGQEAVGLYRSLASGCPDKFQPAVARTMMLLATRHMNEKRPLDAAQLSNDAITVLVSVLFLGKHEYRTLMEAMLVDHRRFCFAAGVPPKW